EGLVAHDHRPCPGDLGRERELDTGESETALPRRERELRAWEECQPGVPPIERQREAAHHLGALPAEDLPGSEPSLLEGRYLRLVEDVAQLDAIARDLHARQMVDREVSQGMRACALRPHH